MRDLHQQQFDKPDDEMTTDDWQMFAEDTEQMYQQALKEWDEYAHEHPEITHEQWMAVVLNERKEG